MNICSSQNHFRILPVLLPLRVKARPSIFRHAPSNLLHYHLCALCAPGLGHHWSTERSRHFPFPRPYSAVPWPLLQANATRCKIADASTVVRLHWYDCPTQHLVQMLWRFSGHQDDGTALCVEMRNEGAKQIYIYFLKA